MDENTLSARLKHYGITLRDSEAEQLWKFHEMLRLENPRLNMTRIHNFETVVRKHYVDSLIVGPMLAQVLGKFPGVLLDFGTGAGFPGIPLAIHYPDSQFILNEGRANRADFLRRVIQECGLKNCEVLGERLTPSHNVQVDAVILRAVGSMRRIYERTHFAIKRAGSLIFLKGPNCSDEIVEMQSARGAHLVADLPYELPHSHDRRRLVLFSIDSPSSMVIRSDSNARFQAYESLHSAKGIKKQERALLCGKRLIEEAAARGIIELMLRSEKDATGRQDELVFGGNLFARLDLLGTGSPLALVRVPEFQDVESVGAGPCIVAPFQDPENIGSAIRAARGFDIQVVLTRESANPFLPRSLRASAGTALYGTIYRGGSLVETLESLRAAGKRIVLLQTTGAGSVALHDYAWSDNCALVAGLEGSGLPGGVKGDSVHIPVEGIESLNAGVALGIAMYEMRRSHFRKT